MVIRYSPAGFRIKMVMKYKNYTLQGIEIWTSRIFKGEKCNMTILFENMFYNANVKSGFQNITNVSIAEINFRLTKMIDNKIFFESLTWIITTNKQVIIKKKNLFETLLWIMRNEGNRAVKKERVNRKCQLQTVS